MPSVRILAPVCLFVLAVSGCATTRFETTGRAPTQPVCQAHGESISALVLWGPQWRPNQKDVPMREAAAQHGIEDFFATSGCYTKVRIRRIANDHPPNALSVTDVREIAAAEAAPPNRVLLITVRELGPIIKLFASFAIVEGGTDVVLQIRSADAASGEVTADYMSHWQHGGPWVIKGVGTLQQDIESALHAALKPMGVQK